MKLITLAHGAVLCEAKASKRHVHFVESGLVALVTRHPAPVVVATVGREGALGGPTCLFGGGITFGRYEMLMPGSALALEATRLQNVLQENRNFHSLCEAYSRMFFAQVLENVACRECHTTEQQCARWLLMCDDRSECDRFELAQDSLAAMLDVPQSEADEIAARLQHAGLIRLRGRLVSILDRRKLEAAACGCCETLHDHYERFVSRAHISRGV